MNDTFTISAQAYEVVWEHLRLPEMPLALLVNRHGADDATRRRVREHAFEELAAAGLADRNTVDDRLRQALTLLAMPRIGADARLLLPTEVRAVAAERDDQTVLVVLADNRVTIHPVLPGRPPRRIVSVLPPVPAGDGHSLTYPSEGATGEDARLLAKMTAHVGYRGQFGAWVVDDAGKRHRANRVVGFYDTPDGRYLIERHGDWTTVSPADSRLLARQIDRLTTTAN